MFGIESKELLIILFAVLILFGPKRIPEVARALGKGLGDIRDALSGVERDVLHAADSLSAPEQRPSPGSGSSPQATVGRFAPGALPAGGAPAATGAIPSGVESAGSETTGAGDAAGDAVWVDGCDASEGSQAADSGAATGLRPEPGPEPGAPPGASSGLAG
jgi:sec-independent protein translocase protein TatB